MARAKELGRVRSKQQRALAGRKLSGCVRGEVEMLDEKGSPGQLSRVDFAAVHGSTLAGRASGGDEDVALCRSWLPHLTDGMEMLSTCHPTGTNLLEPTEVTQDHASAFIIDTKLHASLGSNMRMKLRLARHACATSEKLRPAASEADERPQRASC
jgi:hypothetical protein